MSDKRDYIAVLKALGQTGPLSTTLNRLTDVQMETEDAQLRLALEKLCDAVRLQVLPSTPKGRLLGLSPQQFPNMSAGIAKLETYCAQQRDAAEQQWQILAKRAGWTPPAN